MKRLLLACSTLLVAVAPASAMAKTGLEGRWRNGKMEIAITPCGHSLCGTVVKASAKQQARAESGSGTDLIGARVIKNIQPAGEGAYRADVYLADRDTNVRGTIRQLGANRLEVRGCVLAVLCKTTHWDRISR